MLNLMQNLQEQQNLFVDTSMLETHAVTRQLRLCTLQPEDIHFKRVGFVCLFQILILTISQGLFIFFVSTTNSVDFKATSFFSVPTPSPALATRKVCPAQAVSLSTSGKRARVILNLRNLRSWLWSGRAQACLRELTQTCLSRQLLCTKT